MRTTVTLDPDVYQRLTDAAHRQRTSFKTALNDALRRGLTAQSPSPSEPYEVRPHQLGLRPALDFSKANQLLDDLEVEEFIDATARR
jgi:hypothetical protein